jgi:N-acetyl sugar amidotransferase
VTWAPHTYTYMGRRNMNAWINAGFDNITYTPNQKAHRLVTRLAFENLCHPFQPFIIGQKNLAPKMAIAHKIPLIFFGENEAEYGNPIADNETSKRDMSFYSSDEEIDKIYLGGVNARTLMKEYGLSRADIEPYLPPSSEELNKAGVEVHYLGYYEHWDQHLSYYFAVENTDFLPNDERTEGSYAKYASIDDKIDWFHWYTYFIKFGMGRATDDATHEIRNGHITREEGVRLVRRFDGEFPRKYFKDNLDYMGITEDRFYEVTDKARPPHLWDKSGGVWKLKHQVDFLKD